MATKLVIFDCDGGSDDAWALLLLLKADEEKRLSLLAVTITGCGNTTLENAGRNMFRILKAQKREDIPIYFGTSESIIPSIKMEDCFMFHGHDGFGDVFTKNDNIQIDKLVKPYHAIPVIYDLCVKNSKQISIIVVGPLTNLALCFSMYGENFGNNVKEIFIMGGNYQGVGNFTRAAEFNFYVDPEAAHIVLSKSKCPITILPWEPCTIDRFYICIKWRLEKFGPEAGLANSAIKILNTVEHAQFKEANWNPCDAMLVAAFLFGSKIIKKDSMWHAVVDLKGLHTRGQMVLDHLHEVHKYPENVRIIESIDAVFFKRVVEWAAGLIFLDFK